MMLGEEGPRRFHAQLPYVKIADGTLDDKKAQIETVFTFERNTIVERVEFFSRRQQEHETLTQFHAILTGLAAKCNWGVLEDELIRDIFITNIRKLDLQSKFCSKKKSRRDTARSQSLQARSSQSKAFEGNKSKPNIEQKRRGNTKRTKRVTGKFTHKQKSKYI